MKKLFTLLTMLIVGIGGLWAEAITQQLTLSPNNGANITKSDGTLSTLGSDNNSYGFRWTGAVSGVPVTIESANNADVVGTFNVDTRFQFKNNGDSKFYLRVPDCFAITDYTFKAVYRSSDDGQPTFYEGDNTTGTPINRSTAITVNKTSSFTPASSFYFYVKNPDKPNAALTMDAGSFKITISFDIDALKTRAEELYAMRGTSGYPADGVNVTTNLKNAIDAITGESSTKTAANCYVLYQAINAYIPFNTTSPDVISINFGSNERVFTGTGGIVSVGNWNNCSGASSTTGFSLNKSDGTASGATVTWSCANTWSYKTNVTDDWLVGYLDDGGSGVSIEVSDIPYNRYSLIIYQATDTKNYSFNPPAINGVYYSWDGRRVSKTRNDTNLKYGTSQNATASLGTNTIKLKGLSGRLIIKGGGNVNSARGCIAGIQIVKETELSTVITEQQTSNITTIPEYIEYAGGAGTSGSRVSINHNGGSVKLSGADKTYYLSGSNSATQTTINFDGTTVNYNNELGIGTAIYNINNTQITTPKFITSQGNPNRPAVVNLTGNTVITVTGNSNVDSNQSSIMIGHWNGSSNVTLDNTAKIEAVDAQLLVGKTGNTQTITLNGSSNITAKGIKVSSGASSTSNILNLNGGSLTLGDVGITSYSSSNTIAVNVNENTTITANAETLPLTQPITVAAGKTLTIDGGTSNAKITLPNSLTNNGTIHFKDATLNLTKRDFSELSYTFNNCTAQFAETGDEYKVGGFTITNIPSGVTIKVKRYDATTYEAVTIVNRTATFSHDDVGVSGYAAWLDYTFNLSTIEANTHDPADRVIDNAGNAGIPDQNLKTDAGYDTGNSYNVDDGTLKVMSTPYRSITWPTNYTVAVAGNVPDIENGCLVAFGTHDGGYLAILRGDANNKILLVKGKGNNHFETISTMTAANATELSHLVVFTKNGNTFTVYLDGVQKTQVTYSDALGGGFQIGSIHGGVTGTGVGRVNDMAADIKNKIFAKAVRVYDYVISDDQMSQLTEEFPYTSFGGKYTRTITENSNLSATNAWHNTDTQGNVDIPVNAIVKSVTYYPDVEITTNAASTLTVNANMDTENIKFDGTGKLTIASDGTHHINIYGSVTANGPVSIKYGATDLSSVPVSIGESGSVEFDFSDYDFTNVVTTTEIPVTGYTSDYGNKVTALYPESDIYRSFTLAYSESSHRYVLTVSPKRTVAQTVYAPAGTTQVTDGMYVKMTADAETNDGLLISGDNLIINNTETLIFNQTSGFCTFEIQGNATVTVNNKTAEGYALDGETITITNGTLKLNYGNGDAKINSATINISENGALDNLGWLTVDGTLTVNSDYDKTILNNSGTANPSQTRGTGKIVKGGTGTITMRAMPHCTENEVTTKHPIEITGGVLILSDGAKAGAITGSGTLNVPAATSISVASMVASSTLEGSGYITMTAFQRSNVPTLTNWTGTIAITNADVSGPLSIDNLVNGNNSLVRMSHIQGWIDQNSTTTANIVLDNEEWTYGFNVTGVNNDASYTFTGDISGTGDFMYRQSNQESRTATFNFSGDLSKWTGKFNLNENGEGTTNVKITSTDDIGTGFVNTSTKANTLKVTFESSEAQNIKGKISNSNTGNGSLVLKLLGTGAKTISADIDVSRLKIVKDNNGAEITISGTPTISVGQLQVYTGDNNTVETSLNIILSDADITTQWLADNASCTLIDVADGGEVNVTEFKINGETEYPIGDYKYCIIKDASNDIVLVKHYTRNVTSGNFGSICIENGASVSQMTGVAKVLKVTEITTDRVVMDEVDEMVAGVPYIFKSNDAAINLTLKGETVADAVNAECEDNPNGYLVGNFEPTGVPNSNSDADYNYYILQSNQFKKVTSGTIKSGKNRCYLKVSKVGLSRQATLGIAVDDGGATGIDAINSLMNNDAEIYDLNGRRLNDLRKGINIVNGVKVIVK